MTPVSPLESLDPGWRATLAPVENQVASLLQSVANQSRQGVTILPPPHDILRAFTYPFEDVRVLILGQDPYPTLGKSMGLAFSVRAGVALPPSLRNIFKELEDDLGCPPRTNGDLSGWASQGVCLLNRVLTVEAGATDSHRNLGWETVTDQALRALSARGGPLVGILWGRQAQKAAPMLDGVPLIETAHPSPLSARRGFFGSRPFSTANALLAEAGAGPIRWCVSDGD